MSEMYAVKIDLTKVDKSKLFAGRNGAQYLDVVLFPSRNSQYGDSHMVVQSVSKEERLAGVKGIILGNAKVLGGTQPIQTPAATRKPTAPVNKYVEDNDGKDVPF